MRRINNRRREPMDIPIAVRLGNDAWIDHDRTKVGYETPFNRHFYVFEPPRPLAEIDADLKKCIDRILKIIAGLSA